MRFRVLALTCILLITGCATGYQKYSWAGGYKDKSVGDNKYLVEYYGNGTTSPQTVDEFWNKRASEVCPNGFNVLEEAGGANQGSFTSGTTTFSHPWKKATISCK